MRSAPSWALSRPDGELPRVSERRTEEEREGCLLGIGEGARELKGDSSGVELKEVVEGLLCVLSSAGSSRPDINLLLRGRREFSWDPWEDWGRDMAAYIQPCERGRAREIVIRSRVRCSLESQRMPATSRNWRNRAGSRPPGGNTRVQSLMGAAGPRPRPHPRITLSLKLGLPPALEGSISVLPRSVLLPRLRSLPRLRRSDRADHVPITCDLDRDLELELVDSGDE